MKIFSALMILTCTFSCADENIDTLRNQIVEKIDKHSKIYDSYCLGGYYDFMTEKNYLGGVLEGYLECLIILNDLYPIQHE